MSTTELEGRLRVLEDERAILATLYRYGHSIDYGLEQNWLDCFTEDGAFDIQFADAASQLARATSSTTGQAPPSYAAGKRHEKGVRISGRENLASFIAAHPRAPVRYHKHLVIEPVIEIEDDTARATSYYVVLVKFGNMPEIFGFGRYHDRLVRCSDGRWRLSERVAEIEVAQDPKKMSPRAHDAG